MLWSALWSGRQQVGAHPEMHDLCAAGVAEGSPQFADKSRQMQQQHSPRVAKIRQKQQKNACLPA